MGGFADSGYSLCLVCMQAFEIKVHPTEECEVARHLWFMFRSFDIASLLSNFVTSFLFMIIVGDKRLYSKYGLEIESQYGCFCASHNYVSSKHNNAWWYSNGCLSNQIAMSKGWSWSIDGKR